jgi:hypothetical protein
MGHALKPNPSNPGNGMPNTNANPRTKLQSNAIDDAMT